MTRIACGRLRLRVMHVSSLIQEESSCLSKLVKHRLFESFFGVVVLTNAIFIGIDVDLSARETSRPMALRVMQRLGEVPAECARRVSLLRRHVDNLDE